MGSITSPAPVKLFVGMLSQHTALFHELGRTLSDNFGPIDLESPVWPWDHTAYYQKEMGDSLKRKFIFFAKLISPETIADIKLKTNDLEKRYLMRDPDAPAAGRGGKTESTGRRRINLDPGYLDSAKLILVSTKNYSHRIYLGNGIYGEVTLTYAKSGYHPLPYTYPDYRTGEFIEIFGQARAIYRNQLKEIRP